MSKVLLHNWGKASRITCFSKVDVNLKIFLCTIKNLSQLNRCCIAVTALCDAQGFCLHYQARNAFDIFVILDLQSKGFTSHPRGTQTSECSLYCWQMPFWAINSWQRYIVYITHETSLVMISLLFFLSSCPDGHSYF